MGKKNQPHYRIVVIEHWRKPKGKYIEMLGSYNPRHKAISLGKERILYWLEHGAQTSPTVHNLLVDHKIIKKPKRKATTNSKKKKEEAKQAVDKKSEADKIRTKVEPKD